MPYILTLLFLIIIAVFSWLLIKTIKKNKLLLAVAKEKQRAVTDAISHLRNLLSANKHNSIDENQWYSDICLFFQESFHAAGCCIIRSLTEDKKNRNYEIFSGCGCCGDWHGEKPDIKLTFESDIRKHFFWSSESHLLSDNLGECLPADKKDQFSSAITGVFSIHKHQSFLMLLRDKNQAPFIMDELKDFETYFQVARAGFEIINYSRENENLEDNIDRAHEEGMLQISTGIIHNIGNGMAVLKMTLEHLDEFKSIVQLVDFLQNEIIPAIEKDIAAMKPVDSSQIEQYLGAVKEIMDKISNVAKGHDEELQKLHDKFQNVIEIISLQQQFIGELGTENVVAISTILTDVIKMIEQPLEQNKIELKQDFKSMAQVLLDPALFRQVLLVVCKYSINSINTSRQATSILEISAVESEDTEPNEDGENKTRKMINLEIFNNGYGIDFDPDAEFSTHSADAQQHRELLFCKNKIEKYGGSFQIDSNTGFGAKVFINIPVYEK